jgi:hypothetical protein
MRYLLSPPIRRIFGRVYTDLADMEDMLRDGSLTGPRSDYRG